MIKRKREENENGKKKKKKLSVSDWDPYFGESVQNHGQVRMLSGNHGGKELQGSLVGLLLLVVILLLFVLFCFVLWLFYLSKTFFLRTSSF